MISSSLVTWAACPSPASLCAHSSMSTVCFHAKARSSVYLTTTLGECRKAWGIRGLLVMRFDASANAGSREAGLWI